MARAAAFGVLGGAVGVGVWAAIAHFTGYEVGFVAWAVGGLVGVAAILGAQGRGSTSLGVMTAVIAVGAILAGKLVGAHLLIEDMASEASLDDTACCSLATDIVAEFEEEGVELIWPDPESDVAGVTFGFPVAVWDRARDRWNGMDDAARAELTTSLESEEATARGVATGVVFAASVLRPSSLLWIGLAIASAFKLGATRPGETTETLGVMVTSNAPVESTPQAAAPSFGHLPPQRPLEDDGLPLMSQQRHHAA